MIDPNPRQAKWIPKPVTRPVRVTRDLWWHVFDTSVFITALVFLASLLPHKLPLPLLAGTLATITLVTGWVTIRTTACYALASWLLCSGTFLTLWLAAARLLGTYTEYVIASLVIGFIILAPLGPPAMARYRAMDKDPGADDRARKLRELNDWAKLLYRAGRVRNVQVTSVVPHVNGVQVHGYLGKATDEHGVVTFDRLKDLGAEIATDLRLAADAVTFEQSDPDNSAAFTMSVRTRKGKRKIVYLPESTRFTTINEPLELGLHDNGSKFRLLLREIAVMVVGVIGSGKSNLLNDFTGQLARCEDALVFCIDLKGGIMARPWLMPWIEDPDGVRRPVIDWLATTRREAKLMLEALIEAGDYRASHGGVAEKIIARKNRPAIVLIMDETAVATGHSRRDDETNSRELAVLLARLVETYRAMAILPVVAAVRGDVETMGLSAIKAQALARIGLRVSQSGDADSVFPDDHPHAKLLAKIRDDGAGLVLLKGRMSSPVHFYRVTPKLAYAIAKRTGPYRPVPDPVLEAGLNRVQCEVPDADGRMVSRGAYESRWDRLGETVSDWRASAAEWKAEAGIHEDVSRKPARAGTAVMDRPGSGGGDESLSPEEYVDSVLREAVAGIEDPDGRIHPARQRMRELLYQAGENGLRIGDLHKTLCAEASRTGNPELGAHRGTVHNWLRKDEEAGRVRREGGLMGDPYARWIWIRQAGDDSPLGGLGGGPPDGEGGSG